MSTVVFLSNQNVRALVGTSGKNRVSVSRVCHAQAPEGSILNGMVTNEQEFGVFLHKFWAENQLPKRHVTLVLGGGQTVTRLLQVPVMPHKKLMEYIPREFAGVERTRDPVYSYVRLDREGTRERVLVYMTERSFLKQHLERFQSMGVHLESVVMAGAADITMVNRLSCLKEQTFVVQILDGMSLLNLLFVKGRYFQMNQSRTFGERGTMQFGIESARSVSNLQQFLKTQQIDEQITNVYLTGEFDRDDYEVCSDSILQMDAALEVGRLKEEESIKSADGEPVLEQTMALVGSLFMKHGRENFLYQYYRDKATLARRRKWIMILAPTAAVSLLLVGAAAFQAARWFSLASEVEDQLTYMGNISVINQVEEYDSLAMENDGLRSRADAMGKTKEYLNSYPVYSSAVRQRIQQSAAGIVNADLQSCNLLTGTIEIAASGANAESIYQFVDRLEQCEDVFYNVYYSGFAFSDRNNRWEASVEVYLKPTKQESGQEKGSGSETGEVTS